MDGIGGLWVGLVGCLSMDASLHGGSNGTIASDFGGRRYHSFTFKYTVVLAASGILDASDQGVWGVYGCIFSWRFQWHHRYRLLTSVAEVGCWSLIGPMEPPWKDASIDTPEALIGGPWGRRHHPSICMSIVMFLPRVILCTVTFTFWNYFKM